MNSRTMRQQRSKDSTINQATHLLHGHFRCEASRRKKSEGYRDWQLLAHGFVAQLALASAAVDVVCSRSAGQDRCVCIATAAGASHDW
jgi:hypothetical protein